MVYSAKLPEPSDLCQIAQGVEAYPTSTGHIVTVAKKLGFDENVTDFLNLFPRERKDEFKSQSDFYTRAAELVVLISEERSAPKEGFLNPQD